jgi:GAF domain-containing protein
MRRGSAKGSSPKKKQGTRKAPARHRAAAKRAARTAKPRRSSKAKAKPKAKPKSEAARLTSELNEALQRQAATADILRVIASSPSDVQPVFEAIVVTAARLLRCDSSFIMRCDGAIYSAVAAATLDGLRPVLEPAPRPVDPAADFPSRAIASRKNLYLPDWSKIELPAFERMVQERRGLNSALYLPMLREDQCIGVLGLASRNVNNFAARDIALAESFRDQALIAVENARLFNETREALERQTATADVLNVIGRSPTDAAPVFDVIGERAEKLCNAEISVVSILDGDVIKLAGIRGISREGVELFRANFPMPLDRQTVTARTIKSGTIIHIGDVLAHPTYDNKRLAAQTGYRSCLGVPMHNKGQVVGAIFVARAEPGLFPDSQVHLLQIFADQAVIAMQNVRLFNETQEALERQTATADILKVIASSPDDVQPVFEAIAANANRLIGGFSTAVIRFIDGMAHLAAFTPLNPEADAVLKASLPGPTANFPPFEFTLRGVPTQIEDTEVFADERLLAISRARGFRSALYAPLMNGSLPIGVIGVTRVSPGKFAPHHVQLLQTFADQAAIAIQNVRLFNETKEALERQTATADILKVIASSPDNVQPVFEAIVANATRLIGGFSASVYRFVDGLIHLAAITSVSATADEALRASFPRPIDNDYFRKAQAGELAEVADTEDQPVEKLRDLARARGFRSILYVPLKSSGTSIGVITVSRQTAGPFAAHHVELLQTFADQAVIAIENVRLFNETKEALEHQTATSEVLQAIGNSMADTQPVFERILDSVERLFDIRQCAVMLAAGDGMMHLAARRGIGVEAMDRFYPVPLAQTMAGDVVETGQQSYVASAASALASPLMRRVAETAGDFSVALTPMLWEGRGIGVINVSRAPNEAFSEKELALLRTFADQAVIAIQNARLFNETKEALERQTATADILKVIASSPDNVQPVFDAIAERANKLLGGHATTVLRVVGDQFELAAFTPVSEEADAVLRAAFPRPIAGNPGLEMNIRGEVSETRDTESEPEATPGIRNIARARGFRSRIQVPLRGDSGTIGAISVTRVEPGAFAEHHVQLLQTFADQAVIAIQNVRLFNETKEALERQTATADILKVIASSPDDVQPVFEAIVASAARLIGAFSAGVFRFVDGVVHLAAITSTTPAGDEALRAHYPRPIDETSFTVTHAGEVLQVVDAENDERQRLRDIARERGTRSVVQVPLRSSGVSIGAISVGRKEPGPFAAHHIDLLQTFADQAVIAIENVRLFNETKEALQRQTATSEVLRVISSSSGDLQPVFKVMLDNALKICEASYGNMLLVSGNGFEPAELHNSPPAFADLFKRGPLVPPPGTALGRIIATRKVVHIPDLLAESGGIQQTPLRVITVESMRARTLLAVPMLRESELVGVIVIYRQEVRPFSEKQIELVTNFADQAVIAIENARLLNELRMRTEELSQSLDNLRTAQDRLIQTEKLASLGQLTAGIAHEIKNPLNFVNNFSALSAELTDELNDLLKRAALTDKMQEEVGELTKLLKDNLEKVVQHGKRADSIVKNMLLHSREGSGELRPADVNALVDESLNLAYHGARAEKAGFNITLQRDFDASAGSAELFPQEITRALLNLISNGFYAATRRKTDNGEAGFEPTLLATTKNLGSSIEIRIRDNGTGIPPEVKEKMFNPFFTTKPAGEGTGLGLSMTHDIVVKQHGGRIDVETTPGEFTEFVIVLPRTGNPQKAR